MQDSLSTRSWNGTPIHRRPSDRYVNATAMCQANGKLWADFWRTKRCSDYLEALSETMGIPIVGTDGLVQSREGRDGGTWVHPEVATELARWISPSFSVFVNRWFRETVEAQQAVQTTPAQQQLPAAQEIKAAVELVLNIHDELEARNWADDRNRLETKRHLITLQNAALFVSTGALPGTTNVLSPAENLPKFCGRSVDPETPLTVVEFATAYLDKELSKTVVNKDTLVGRVTHQLFQDRHGREAMQTTHLSVKAEEGRKRFGLGMFTPARTGFACAPRVYLPCDWDLILQAMWKLGSLNADTLAELQAECQQFRHGLD